jgi:hypothetical protein
MEAAMCLRKFFMTVLAVNIVALSAAAGDLSITFHDPLLSPTVHDIQWDPTQTSPIMDIGLENTTGTTDNLCGWQLGLELVPDAGATGTLRFKSVSIPGSYIFAGGSVGLSPPFSVPSNIINVISDASSFLSGVPVPSSGTNLLQFDFDASLNPSGLFHIMAVPSLTRSNWYSADASTRYYYNVPLAGGAKSLGSVTVVPEPSIIILLLAGLAAGACAFSTARNNSAP